MKNISRSCESLNETDDEVLQIQKTEILAEITLNLLKMKFEYSGKIFWRSANIILKKKLPRLKFPVFEGNRGLFMNRLIFRITKMKL